MIPRNQKKKFHMIYFRKRRERGEKEEKKEKKLSRQVFQEKS